MAITYAKDSTNQIMIAGGKGAAGRCENTFTQRRIFMRVDVSGLGLVVGDVDYVELHTKVYSRVGSTTYTLYSATSGTWGTTLDATRADFISTNTNTEDSMVINSTGWKIWSVDKNNLNFSGYTHFRITAPAPALGENRSINVWSQNRATSADRPFLRLYLLAGGVVNIPLLTTMGVGS